MPELQTNSSEIEIPQIKPENQIELENKELVNPTKPKTGDSILLPPELKPKENANNLRVEEPIIRHNVNSSMPTKSNKKFSKVIFAVLAVLLLLLVVAGLQIFAAYQNGKRLYTQALKLQEAANSQNVSTIKTEIGNTKKSLSALQGSVKGMVWMQVVPLIGSYVKDANNALDAGQNALDAADITLTTAEPYMAMLGFGTGHKAEDSAKTTQERIDFVVKAIPDLLPKIDTISQKVDTAKRDLDTINPDRYPVKFAGKEIRTPLRNALETLDEVATFVSQSKPLLQETPYLLGVDSPRTYLVLFQNDKELRPTGGFLTAYSIMKVDKAKFNPVLSNDIYNLDAKYQPTLPAPDPLVKYIKGPYILSKNIRLRDMNWSPDFYTTMNQFLPEAAKVGVTGIDGVIAVDTQLLVNLLDAIGPIGVPGFGNFSTKIEPKCNCPQVIYELESFADVEGPIVWDPNTGKIVYRPPNSDNRKKIIGPLMNSIMANAMGQPKEKMPALFNAAFKSLMEKHVLFYLNDPKAEAAVESFGIGGQIKDYKGDYLALNDANLGGRKSNLYVTTEVEQKYEVDKGDITKTVTITYKNPERQDGWLNSVLPDWLRVYVPKGSTLISQEGFDEKATPYDELDKTVFAGFFNLRPEGVAKVTLKYKLPFKAYGDMGLLIQKQPGLDNPLYTVTTHKSSEEFFLTTDKELKLRI